MVIIYAKRMTTVDLEFTDQIMCFKVNQLGKQELKTFYKAVSQVQENVNNQVGSYEPNVNNTVNSVNKVESLTEISKLHNQGLITQEEFEKLKKEVMEQ
jgi:hypothetical protein